MVEEKVPKTDDSAAVEKVTKAKKATKKVAKKAAKIEPEKKQKLDKVEKHIDSHIAPMSKRVSDKAEVNEELIETVPKAGDKKSIWQKIKGIFGK